MFLEIVVSLTVYFAKTRFISFSSAKGILQTPGVHFVSQCRRIVL